MTPQATTPGRRRNMQANRRKDTKPELRLRSLLHAAGYRYRVDFRLDLEGSRVRPDIIFTRRKLAVFVDGCFWHSCPRHGHAPKANQDYWTPKLARNRERDARNAEALTRAGWTVLRLWEHVPADEAFAAVIAALRPSAKTAKVGPAPVSEAPAKLSS